MNSNSIHALIMTWKKEEIWFSIWQSPFTNRNVTKAKWEHKNTTKKFDYTEIEDRPRTVSWRNYSHPTGLVIRLTDPKFQSPQQPCNQKDTHV